MRYIKIKSIKRIDKRKTFDLQVVDNDNFFLSNNVLSHNSGKSATLKSCTERIFLRGNTKIIDLYSGGALEGAYYSLKSTHPFWFDREFSYNKRLLKSMEIPVRCLVPMCKNMPNSLPDIFQTFTLPVNTLTENDLKAMLGNALTKNEIALWRKISDNFNKNTSLLDLLNVILDAQTKEERIPGIHGTGISSLYNMFSTFEKHMLFSKKSNPLSLDLLSELRNKKIITSIILKYFPEELWGFIVNYFISHIYNLILKGEIKHNVVLIIREAGDFLVSLGESSPQEEAVRHNFSQIVRKGRKHRLFFWIDNQSALNVDAVKDEFPVKICHLVDNTTQLQNALGDLGAMLLTREDYSKIRTFTPGKCFVLENRGLFNPQILPPLTRFSGEEGADFDDIWRQEKGERFKNIKLETEVIKEEYANEKEKWHNVVVDRKKQAKLAKEVKAVKKENEKSLKKSIAKSEKSTVNRIEIVKQPIEIVKSPTAIVVPPTLGSHHTDSLDIEI